MRYGNTGDVLRRVTLSGLGIGVVTYVFSAAMVVFYEKLPLSRLVPLLSILVMPALVMILAVGPTVMFSLHLVDGWVEHRFLDRWVLSRARASDFVSMQRPATLFAAKLIFADGTRIRFFGAQVGVLDSLEEALKSSSPS